MEFYKCDICLQKINNEDGYIPISIPKQISLKQGRILKNELHICETCYKPEYLNKLKEYEHQFWLHTQEFFKNNKLYL